MGKNSKALAHGLEEYPKSGVVFGNLMMILWIALGAIACWFFHPLLAWVYLIVAITAVFVVLRKLICTNCYYYDRWCATGWGKLSALFFKKGNIDRFGASIGVKLASVIYGLLSLIPLIFLAVSLIQGFTVPKITVFILLLSVSFYSGTIGRGKACVNCRMRSMCPGSVKK
ncbi:MAG: hypothetical protein ABIB93_00310 [Chloroflexota bacterium]